MCYYIMYVYRKKCSYLTRNSLGLDKFTKKKIQYRYFNIKKIIKATMLVKYSLNIILILLNVMQRNCTLEFDF